jgi:hypothetical protein
VGLVSLAYGLLGLLHFWLFGSRPHHSLSLGVARMDTTRISSDRGNIPSVHLLGRLGNYRSRHMAKRRRSQGDARWSFVAKIVVGVSALNLLVRVINGGALMSAFRIMGILH